MVPMKPAVVNLFPNVHLDQKGQKYKNEKGSNLHGGHKALKYILTFQNYTYLYPPGHSPIYVSLLFTAQLWVA